VSLKNTSLLLSIIFLALLQAACTTINPSSSTPRPAHPTTPSESALQEETAKIDFKIVSGVAHDRNHDPFLLSMVPDPLISALGNGMYRMGIAFLWDPRSGRRYNVPLLTSFYYDGDDIIFFNDGNHNHKIDRWEASERHDVSDKHKTGEIVLPISAEVIDNAPWYDLELRLVFDH